MTNHPEPPIPRVQVSQSATVSGSIAKAIAAVSQAVTKSREGGGRVEASATELHGLAGQMGTLVARFKKAADRLGAVTRAVCLQ